MDLHRFTPVHPDAMVSEQDGTHVLYSEVEPLEGWKESAMEILGEWDQVHLALGQPGKLGESMAAASLAEVQKLRALVQVLFDALANMKIDIYGPLTTELKAAVIALNAAKEEGFVPTNTEDNG